MKNKLQGMVMGIVIGVLLSITFVQASGTATPIQVYFKELVFKFNGVEKKPEQPSFIYDGTTYVPIRFVSESLGVPVKYNGDTGTISLGQTSYPEYPAMKIDTGKSYEAEVKTNKGDFTIELFAKDAPKTVNSFAFLANDNFYDGVVFHRILQSFVIQTGDPTGTGRGGPGYTFADELNNGHKYEVGTVAMANAGPNTNGSQFFICTGDDCTQLNRAPNYTIFGKVSKGMDVVTAIAATPVQANDYGDLSQPKEEVKIESIKIVERSSEGTS
ncbi:peptidylprolyl isomerase [Paenibacillus hodogayensis]|uniref:Peptidyl-prolyl cis-trans isomerase n=1 Tax=Paenibacillus hodogayensis TaxID=279208 RepID=A0ABV5VQ97_9BACL